MSTPSTPPTKPPAKPTPENSTCLIVGVVLGGLGAVFSFGGVHVLGFLLGLPALVVTIVGFVRNEPLRGLGALGILLAIIAVF